jgi:site-specific DNA-methyltransferase (adenine-specific)
MTVRIIQGDMREKLAELADSSVDSIVTDPPYGLGFMGKGWDHGVPGVEFWTAAIRVAKPGAYLLAFGGTRTFHRLAVAIEDAGWEIRDTVMWVYGSGFPKSHNGPWGGTALKPAWEPVIMARKPLAGTVAANVEQFGTGGLNIDGCRITTLGEDMGDPSRFLASDAALHDGWQRPHKADTEKMSDRAYARFERSATLGRWPANLIHDGSDEVLAAFPESDGQSGAVRGTEPSKTGDANCYGTFGRVPFGARGDTGSAARFFYCAKADRTDRNDGLRGRKKKPLNWSSGTQSPGTFQAEGTDRTSENHHPTVKPTDLMRYLCRLVTPKGGTVLDPFMGSGSTLKAAELEGFSAIGIEIDPEYCEIARNRIASDAPLFAEVS